MSRLFLFSTAWNGSPLTAEDRSSKSKRLKNRFWKFLKMSGLARGRRLFTCTAKPAANPVNRYLFTAKKSSLTQFELNYVVHYLLDLWTELCELILERQQSGASANINPSCQTSWSAWDLRFCPSEPCPQPSSRSPLSEDIHQVHRVRNGLQSCLCTYVGKTQALSFDILRKKNSR